MNHLSAIRTFVSAADYKSFSAAAKALNIEVSTVSRHISELEAYLQVTLFNRSTRGLALTETGAFFLLARPTTVITMGGNPSVNFRTG